MVVPYADKETSMIFALPKDASKDLLQQVSLQDILDAVDYTKPNVILVLPKYKIE